MVRSSPIALDSTHTLNPRRINIHVPTLVYSREKNRIEVLLNKPSVNAFGSSSCNVDDVTVQ